MFAYPIIIAAMIASGLFIGWINFSYLWGMIPAVIGGFCGSYYSKFGRMLLKPGIDDYQREKILSVTRVLTIMWTVISAIFFATDAVLQREDVYSILKGGKFYYG